MTMNYNITLLKTIKEPLFQSFDDLKKEIDAVLSSQKSASDISTREIVNIIGSLQMVGRPSLVLVSKSVREAIERVQSSEKRAWDHIRVSSLLKAAQNVVDQLFIHVKALVSAEKSYIVDVWPAWTRLEQELENPQPDVDSLFDPDPQATPDEFAPLELATLRELSAPHLNKYKTELEKLSSSSSPTEWEQGLRRIGEVFDWAFALKHRLGYHPYWLAARARIAWELQQQDSDRARLIFDLGSAHVELRKFAEDSRKPRPESVQQMIYPLLQKWPAAWSERHHVLQNAVDMFSLEEYWKERDRVMSAPVANSSAITSDPKELLESVRTMKTTWTNLAGTEGGDARPFLRSLMTFMPKYELFPNPGSKNLSDALKAVAQRFVSGKRNDVPSEFAQEVATALLLIEETIEKKGRWPAELEKQSETVLKRVTASAFDQMDQLLALPPVIWGSERRRHHSQEAVSKVVSEVLNDLKFVEDVFDEFFRRDAVEARMHSDEVKQKISTSTAILRALGQNNAAAILDVVQKCSGILRRDAQPVEFKKEYGMLTMALTGVTSFLNSFEKGDPEAFRLLEPALAHLGLSQKATDKKWDQFTGDALAQAVQTHNQVEETSEEPDNEQDRIDLMQRRAQSSFDAAQAWEDTVEDQELADAFFEEAALLLSNITSFRKELMVDPDRSESLTNLRRQFHTLKGSGRTTQLWGLGEFSRRIEVRLNEALQRNERYAASLDRIVQFAFQQLELSLNELNSYQKTTFSSEMMGELAQVLSGEDIEQTRLLDEQRQAEEAEQIRLAEEQRLAEEAEQARLLEEQRLAEEAEQARVEEQRLAEEAEQARVLEEQRLAEEAEQARLLEEQRLEEQRLAEEAEQARVLEEQRLAEEAEQARVLEEQRLAEEAEQARLLEEQRLEEQRLAEEAEQARLLEEQRLEEQRLAEEEAELDRLAAEAELAQLVEAQRLHEENELARQAEEQRLAEEAERARIEEEERATERAEFARLADEVEMESPKEDISDVVEVEPRDADDVVWLNSLSDDVESVESVEHVVFELPTVEVVETDVVPHSSLDQEEEEELQDDLADVISDLETHRDNLSELGKSAVIDPHLLHWSVHTLASLGRGLDQERYRVFCKTLEQKIEACMEDEGSGLSEDKNQTLKKFVFVLLEKTEQLILSPRASLEWDLLDSVAEEELKNFEYLPSSSVDDYSTAPVFDDLHSEAVQEEQEGVSDGDWDAINTHMSIIMVQMEALQKLFVKLSQKKK